MAIQFTYYPESNRVPGIFVEMDPSQANTALTLQRSLLLGQITEDGAATPNTPLEVESVVQVQQMCGRGSILAQMATNYLAGDNFGDLWLLPLADDEAAMAAHGELAITGPSTAAGTLNLYLGGIRVRIPVYAADTAAAIATSIRTAINANLDLAVTAAGTTNTVALTARNKGEAANDIDIRLNYLGQAGGEATPAGVEIAITPMSGGTANPEIADGLANLSDQTFDFIVTPYTDTANLDMMKFFLDDHQGRWSWEQMLYGGAFSAYRGTLGQCTFFGTRRNDQHMSIMAFNDSPDPAWVWAAQIGAFSASSLRVDPGLPLQYIGTQLKAPPLQSRWILGERNTLLFDGMSTFRVGDDGSVIMERMRTTYQRNAAGADDDSYLDTETMYGLMYVARNLANYLLTRYARKKLVSDQTQILAGSNTVNALMIKASTIAAYRALEATGFVQNSTIFAKAIVVENAGRGLVKILAPVDLVNQLRQIAILLQFRKS
ncbi:MAG TPA: phage tail sheath subtilisin-like domain-containing protein [Xanthobacteraceae bacterium]|nr:phage tail sheath subtilisin-like domain-containing protein [Xanthobacteraceae bacterium]